MHGCVCARALALALPPSLSPFSPPLPASLALSRSPSLALPSPSLALPSPIPHSATGRSYIDMFTDITHSPSNIPPLHRRNGILGLRSAPFRRRWIRNHCCCYSQARTVGHQRRNQRHRRHQPPSQPRSARRVPCNQEACKQRMSVPMLTSREQWGVLLVIGWVQWYNHSYDTRCTHPLQRVWMRKRDGVISRGSRQQGTYRSCVGQLLCPSVVQFDEAHIAPVVPAPISDSSALQLQLVPLPGHVSAHCITATQRVGLREGGVE